MAELVIDAAFIKELEEANALIVAESHRRAQGEPVVLLVKDSQYAEVVRKDGDDVTLSSNTRYFHASAAELQRDGWKAIPAFRVIKANGTWMFYAETPEGTDWYIYGKKEPAVRQRKIK